ncbi:MAG: AAA family ATPase [Phycisphaerae bacterium]|nr:AAA family ATPase [Phycisphaerae bacterium]
MNEAGEYRPELVQLSDVKPRQLEWLWLNRIPLGKVSLLIGNGGQGKGLTCCDLAGRITRGRAWPDDLQTPQPAGGVLWIGSEDALDDTLVPRLMAAGADLTRVQAIKGVWATGEDGSCRLESFSLTADADALRVAVESVPDCRLIILDPLTGHLGRADLFKDADVREAMAPLVRVAEEYRLAVVCIVHLRKAASDAAIHRVQGSVGVAALARAVWLVARDPADPEKRRRVLAPVKANLAPDTTALAFTVEDPDGSGPRLHWSADPVDVTADELLATPQRTGPDPERRDEAADFLADLLAAGPMQAKEVQRQAKDAGVAWRTIRRAGDVLGVKHIRRGFGNESVWFWSLPDEGGHGAADVNNVDNLATYGQAGVPF